MSVTNATTRDVARNTALGTADVEQIDEWLVEALENEDLTNSGAVAQVFLRAVEAFPRANATDLWNFGVRRSYLNHVADEVSSVQQSWRCAAGPGFERFLVTYYNQRLPRYLQVTRTTNGEVHDTLANLVGEDVPDLALLGRHDGQWSVFGGVHALTSLKGRLGNHVDEGVGLRNAGLTSHVVTLDSHVPTDAVTSVGEFDTTTRNAVTQLADRDDAFDALFSFNERTQETNGVVTVARVGETRFNDQLVDTVVSDWEEFAATLIEHEARQV